MVWTTRRNSKRYILGAVNATSAIGHECMLVVWIWCTVNASTHSRESRNHDSKGRSLVSKDIWYMLHAARSLSSLPAMQKKREKKRERRVRPGDLSSLRKSHFLPVSPSPFFTCVFFFSYIPCFSSVRVTPVLLESRVWVFDREGRNLFNRCS